MAHLPNSEVVAVAWLKGIPAMTSAVGTTLPADTAWDEGRFVQVATVGGSPDIDIPERRPVLQVDCWAANPGSGKPPWGRANELADLIRDHCYQGEDTAVPVQRLVVPSPGSYEPARVQSAYLLTEPRRVPSPGDEARFARYTFDMIMSWCPSE